MCFTLQRYKFSSKSQPNSSSTTNWVRCVLPCKGTNFQANHNAYWSLRRCNCDVFYLAKVQIFKQITTSWGPHDIKEVMCFTLQRYKFSSKSQHLAHIAYLIERCVLPCKGTNFQANHNGVFILLVCLPDVFYLAKVQIFKQITTAVETHKILIKMCFTLQRYKFSSKSQLIFRR